MTTRLRTILEKASTPNLLREMIGFTAERLMELEVEELTHAERKPEGITPSLPRPAMGDGRRYNAVAHPELRNGSYFQVLLESRRWPKRPWLRRAGGQRARACRAGACCARSFDI
jgi:hypothetical protein